MNKLFNRALLATAISLFCILPLLAQVSFGLPEKFDDDWLFSLSDDSLAANADYNDSNWRRLRLPHDWSVEGIPSPSLASCTGYLPGGVAWYRKHFSVSDSLPLHYIYFEGIYCRSSVYLNGHLLGYRPNGFSSFLYNLSPYLQSGDNVLSVRVDHSHYADCRWYAGSGIDRDVWLISAYDTHIAQWGVDWRVKSLSDKEAVVDIDVETEGDAQQSVDVVIVLTDASGKVVAQDTAISNGRLSHLSLLVSAPHCWSPDSPYLYSLHTSLYVGDHIVDSTTTPVGLRTLTFDADKGFALNGVPTKVKGVCLHHDGGVLGSVVPREVWERRLTELKSLGVNAVRMSHNPQAPMVYDLCDRLGLLVMDEASDEWEFPKRKWVEGWNIGQPSYDGTYDFFNEWIERDVADMVRRDRTHPCVFLWSIGNEVDYPNDPYSHPILDSVAINQPMFGGYIPSAPDARRIGSIAERLAAVIRSIDRSRPTTGALAGVVMSNETSYPSAVDVVGYNYTENRYDLDHSTYPSRVIYGSETSRSVDAWRAVADRDFIFGQFVWTGADYLGESRRWPSRGFGSGFLDFANNCKPEGWLRAALWCNEPTIYIGTVALSDSLTAASSPSSMVSNAYDIWNYDPKQMVRVLCFTNAPQARLLLDGRIVGEMKSCDISTAVISWDIPFSAGCLTAEGCDMAGNVLSTYSIQTSSLPYMLRVSSDISTLTDDHSLAQISVEVVDEQGIPVRLADNNISCRIEGDAELLGMENGNNSDMSAPQGYGDHLYALGAERSYGERRAYHGRLLAYVRKTNKATSPQQVRITFSSPLLQPAELILNTE